MITPTCPRCESLETVATPLSGPAADFHCYECDQSFTVGDVRHAARIPAVAA